MATTAQKMVEALECALQKNVGVVEVQVDGQRIKYDRRAAMDELKYWQQQQAKSNGTRPIHGQIKLGGAW